MWPFLVMKVNSAENYVFFCFKGRQIKLSNQCIPKQQNILSRFFPNNIARGNMLICFNNRLLEPQCCFMINPFCITLHLKRQFGSVDNTHGVIVLALPVWLVVCYSIKVDLRPLQEGFWASRKITYVFLVLFLSWCITRKSIAFISHVLSILVVDCDKCNVLLLPFGKNYTKV